MLAAWSVSRCVQRECSLEAVPLSCWINRYLPVAQSSRTTEIIFQRRFFSKRRTSSVETVQVLPPHIRVRVRVTRNSAASASGAPFTHRRHHPEGNVIEAAPAAAGRAVALWLRRAAASIPICGCTALWSHRALVWKMMLVGS